MSKVTTPSQLAENVSENRKIVLKTRGLTNGPITRLISPSVEGQIIKPFVFLDAFDTDARTPRPIAFHPHSGIATVSIIFQGKFKFEETSGTEGVLGAGAVEWMRASGGVWHAGTSFGEERVQGYQLWVALPPELENAESQSFYLSADDIKSEGPARVILGNYGNTESAIFAPSGINILDILLKRGEQWVYHPPKGHTVSWLAIQGGKICVPSEVSAGELVVFEESEKSIRICATAETRFVLGSAIKHPYNLVLGRHSVHTTQKALEKGEAEIQRVGKILREHGKIH